MNLYKIMCDRHQKEFNELAQNKTICIVAFSESDFKKQLASMNLTIDDIYTLGGGVFVRKDYKARLKELFKRQKDELKTAIQNDKVGNGFIKDMFIDELNNHEYLYTYDVEYSLSDICHSLQITMQDIYNNKALHKGLQVAIKELKSYED